MTLFSVVYTSCVFFLSDFLLSSWFRDWIFYLDLLVVDSLKLFLSAKLSLLIVTGDLQVIDFWIVGLEAMIEGVFFIIWADYYFLGLAF
jgi:hypothetical protein